jgi:tetratricopeptide (TPR) repeat protein
VERDIDAVVDTLRNTDRGCALLIGAGVSAKAGIPLANGFVGHIEECFPSAYQRASKKLYPHCMAELTRGERHGLIKTAVDNARVNWAHIALAQLIKTARISRVLTVNFDPLVMRACALVGVYPAIYDFAASDDFKPAFVPDPAIFHLHGQHSGFVQLHTENELSDHFARLKPVFSDAGTGRPWLVVGYSGENDPVFEHLAQVESFDHGLYWIGYKDSEPPAHVREKLLQDGKEAWFVRGFDADSFFVKVAQSLDCFPPEFIAKPFSHLKSGLEQVVPFDVDEESDVDLVATVSGRLQEAIDRFEDQPQEVMSRFLAGDFEAVERLTEASVSPSLAVSELSSWSMILRGNALSDQAKMKSGEEADRLFEEAGQKFDRAVEIKDDKHEAYYNWGNALSHQAKVKSGEEADRLLEEAGQKFARAIVIKGDAHDAYNNWGIALFGQAKMKGDEEAGRLFEEAGQKYARAVEIKDDKHEAYYNWGIALSEQAKMKSGEEADRLFEEAGQKFARAVEIKDDKHEAYYNWGIALSEQAKMKSGDEANRLFEEAGQKYARAIEIKDDNHEAYSNFGAALSDQAKMKSGEEADRLFEEAGQKFARAVEIKDDAHQAYYNWGSSLLGQAGLKSEQEADRLFEEAGQKFARAVEIKEDFHEAYNNWGGALWIQAKMKIGEDSDRLCKEAERKFGCAVEIKPDKHETYFNWGTMLSAQASMKSGEEARRLFEEAGQKFARAVEIRPVRYDALGNWGVMLTSQASMKSGEEADRLFGESLIHLETAHALNPSESYNLACLCALTGRQDDCRQHLLNARGAGTLPDASHLAKDTDLLSVRSLDWFAEFSSP